MAPWWARRAHARRSRPAVAGPSVRVGWDLQVVGWVRLGEDDAGRQATPPQRTLEWIPCDAPSSPSCPSLLVWLADARDPCPARPREARSWSSSAPSAACTAHYKADATPIVAEAGATPPTWSRSYTPNATWSKVKAAAQGANVLVYLGPRQRLAEHVRAVPDQHQGRARPRPVHRRGLVKTVYYGEEFIRTTSGSPPTPSCCSTTSATPRGTRSPAWRSARSPIPASASTTTAPASSAPARVRCSPRATRRTPPRATSASCSRPTGRWTQVFRAAPTFHDNVVGPYASQRTPGLQYMMDPDTAAPSGYYRSLVGDLDPAGARLSSRPGSAARTRHPARLRRARGRRGPADGGAGLFAHAPRPPPTPRRSPRDPLPHGTKLRVTAEADPAADGTRILACRVLGGTAKGFVRAPRSCPATARRSCVDARPERGLLSPNDDGVNDSFVVDHPLLGDRRDHARGQERGRHHGQDRSRSPATSPASRGTSRRPRRRRRAMATTRGRSGARTPGATAASPGPARSPSTARPPCPRPPPRPRPAATAGWSRRRR